MDKLLKNDIFDLTEVFFKIAKKMSPEQIKYYGRNEEKLEELLLNQQVSIIGKPVGSVLIPALEADKTEKVIFKAPFKQSSFSLDIGSRIKPDIPASRERITTAFPLHCWVSHDEIVDQLGGIESLNHLTFTLNQVKFLAQQQTYTNKKGLLTQMGSNHFLIDGRRQQKEWLTLWWNKSGNLTEKSERGGWSYYLSGNYIHQPKNGNLLTGRLFILE
jgi:hypothetical protein